MIIRLISATKLISFLFLASALALACDNPVDNDDHDHAGAEGFVLTSSGEEVVRYENELFLFNEESGFAVDDQLRIFEAASAEFEIVFLDHDGDHFTPDDDLMLDWLIGNQDIVDLQHADENKWSFQLNGISEGETTVTFYIVHGEHNDFTSLPLPVQVAQNEEN
ncbi:MAG: hypothetical protein WD266_08005 [Balneolales bacterium]